MKSYCSRDPRRLSELVRNKFIQLKEIWPKVAVLSSVNIFDNTQLDSGTDTTDGDEATCVPEPLGSLFESRTINYNTTELENYSKNAFSQCEKSYTQKTFLTTCVKSPNIRVSLAHGKHKGLGELHHCLQKQSFQLTNILVHSLLSKISCSAALLLQVKLLIQLTDYGKNMKKYAR